MLTIPAAPAFAQSSSPFQSAPGPVAPKPHSRPAAPETRPSPEPLQPAIPPPPAARQWEGTTGIWHMRVTIAGQKVSGIIECFRKGRWSGWGPTFDGTVDAAGTVSAVTVARSGWVDRKISGIPPTLTIVATRNNAALACSNGHVELKKLQ